MSVRLVMGLTGSTGNADRPDGVRSAIVIPNKHRDARGGLVTVKLADSTVLTGMLRNEDNFSLQLPTRDGSFHPLNKTDIISLHRQGSSAMPWDYNRTLSPTELSDLASCLLKTAGAENTRKPAHRLEAGDDE